MQSTGVKGVSWEGGGGTGAKGFGTMTQARAYVRLAGRNAKLKYAGNVRVPESRYSIIAGLPRLQLVPVAVIRSVARANATRVSEITRPQSNRGEPASAITRPRISNCLTFKNIARHQVTPMCTRAVPSECAMATGLRFTIHCGVQRARGTRRFWNTSGLSCAVIHLTSETVSGAQSPLPHGTVN